MDSIAVMDLKKCYGDTRAVDGISFTVERGEVFGLLGPNGAGKTTTIEIIEGLRLPDSGEVYVLGLDVTQKVQEVKSRIGVQLQTTALFPRLTVREVLDLFRTFFPGKTRSTDELIQMVNLGEKEKTLSKNLSGGQRQRLSVALALINQPEVVFLDEPTTGLDPQARRAVGVALFHVHIQGSPLILMALILLGAMMFIALGYLISGLARTQDSVSAITSLIQFPLLFLSGIFFPIDLMPQWIKPVVVALPLTYLADLLRQVMIGATPAFSLPLDLGMVCAWLVACSVLALKFFRWE